MNRINHVALVKQFLRNRSQEELVIDEYPFVTISREAAAGGHTLAREILRRLETKFPGDLAEGWEVFDHKLCLMIAQDEKLGITFDQLLAEEYRSEISQVINEMIAQKAARYRVYKTTFEIVRMLATIGKCVIVGRAGMCITADLPLGVNIRLVANRPVRVKRMMQLLEVGETEASRKVREQDRDRRRLVHDFFGKEITDPLLYDAIFNTDRMATEEIADVVVDMIAQKMARFPGKLAQSV